MLGISRVALNRTLIGTGLKSIGTMARIYDIPREHTELRRKIAIREAFVVGTIFVASLLVESLFRLLKPAMRKNPVIQFIPQAVAYGFAEWLSREVFPVKESFKKMLDNENAEEPEGTSNERLEKSDDDHEPTAAYVLSESSEALAQPLFKAAPYWQPAFQANTIGYY